MVELSQDVKVSEKRVIRTTFLKESGFWQYINTMERNFQYVRIQCLKQGIPIKALGFSLVDCESSVPMEVNNNMSHFLPCPLMHETPMDQ
jgi:hypothetical protein